VRRVPQHPPRRATSLTPSPLAFVKRPRRRQWCPAIQLCLSRSFSTQHLHTLCDTSLKPSPLAFVKCPRHRTRCPAIQFLPLAFVQSAAPPCVVPSHPNPALSHSLSTRDAKQRCPTTHFHPSCLFSTQPLTNCATILKPTPLVFDAHPTSHPPFHVIPNPTVPCSLSTLDANKGATPSISAPLVFFQSATPPPAMPSHLNEVFHVPHQFQLDSSGFHLNPVESSGIFE